MAKRKKKQITKKESFGGCDIDHFSPPLSEDVPKGINLAISFEDGLKLHLALGQILGQLNSYKRSTTAGKLSAINLCVSALRTLSVALNRLVT